MKGVNTFITLKGLPLLLLLALSCLLSATLITTSANALDDMSTAPLEKWDGADGNPNLGVYINNNYRSDTPYFVTYQDNTAGNGCEYWTAYFNNDTSVSETLNVVSATADAGATYQLLIYSDYGAGHISHIQQSICNGNASSITGGSYSSSLSAWGLTGKYGYVIAEMDQSTAGSPIQAAGYQWDVNFVNMNPPTGGTGPLEVYRPDIKACIEFNKIKIQDKSTLPPPYKLHLIVIQGTFETQNFFYEGTIDAGTTVEQTFETDDPVSVQAFYYDMDGNLLADSNTADYRETNITFSDIKNQCQDTTNENVECDENDHCTVPTEEKYEDCTTHNFLFTAFETDFSVPSPSTVACAVNQLWLRLTDFLAFLFVPDPDNITHVFGIITEGFQETLGFMYQTIDFGIDLISAFLTPSSATDLCSWSFGNVFNGNFKLNFCSFEQQFPTPFSIVQFTIQAFTVFGLMSGIYAEYRRILTQ